MLADFASVIFVDSGPNPVHWSSCSRQQLQDSFDQGLDYCLQNVPEKTYDGPVCGNGFMEEGEECDCGLPEVMPPNQSLYVGASLYAGGGGGRG